MKNTKINILLMAALLAVQTSIYAKKKQEEPADKRTWSEFAYNNRYNIALGSAAVGLGALGYVYGDDFMTWFNQLSPENKEKAQEVLKKSVDKDLQIIQQQQEVVVAQEVAVAQKEQKITNAQQQVAQRQSWLQSILNFVSGSSETNDPEVIKLRENMAANEAKYLADNPNGRSSNDFRSDRERAEHMRNMNNTSQQLAFRRKQQKEYLPKLANALRQENEADFVNLLDNSIQEKQAAYDQIEKDNAESKSGGYVSDLLAGKNESVNKAASKAGESLVDAANSAAQYGQDAYNSISSYWSPKAEPTPDLVSEEEPLRANDIYGDSGMA
ncbi:MAG: hypothetical protein Q8Q60_02265 [Candidatus Chromulinivorax sp.]|nr:hypothetical protein [Candidatus Chromulinivorax sp.]